MKKITCQAMGGSCDTELTGETAQVLAENGKKHVHEQADSGDEAHKAIVEKMSALSEQDHQKWMEDFSAKFDTLEDA